MRDRGAYRNVHMEHDHVHLSRALPRPEMWPWQKGGLAGARRIGTVARGESVRQQTHTHTPSPAAVLPVVVAAPDVGGVGLVRRDAMVADMSNLHAPGVRRQRGTNRVEGPRQEKAGRVERATNATCDA